VISQSSVDRSQQDPAVTTPVTDTLVRFAHDLVIAGHGHRLPMTERSACGRVVAGCGRPVPRIAFNGARSCERSVAFAPATFAAPSLSTDDQSASPCWTFSSPFTEIHMSGRPAVSDLPGESGFSADTVPDATVIANTATGAATPITRIFIATFSRYQQGSLPTAEIGDHNCNRHTTRRPSACNVGML
jgi:hypothetical protein